MMKEATLLQSFLKNAIDGILTIDPFGSIESMNPAACKLFEYSEDEVVSKNIGLLISLNNSMWRNKQLPNKIPTIVDYVKSDRELSGLKKSGHRFPITMGVSEFEYDGKTIFAGFIHDLSLQKEAEEKLKQYATHLEELVEIRTQSLNNSILDLQLSKVKMSQSLEMEKELGKLKNRFLSMASHEFRTPLSTVQLSASLIEKYAEPLLLPNINKHVKTIKNAVSDLTVMLNEFLCIETLESGTIKPEFAPFSLISLGEEVVEEMQLLVKKNQNIVYEYYGNTTKINLDRNLVKNSIINLLTNAIKYSGEDSTIAFRAGVLDKDIVITVHDNGIGIPKEEQKHLFKEFFRAQNTGTIPGTGLGLNIASHYVSLMNGKIDFISTKEQGTIFTLKFPLL